jgi:hypothetical protein
MSKVPTKAQATALINKLEKARNNKHAELNEVNQNALIHLLKYYWFAGESCPVGLLTLKSLTKGHPNTFLVTLNGAIVHIDIESTWAVHREFKDHWEDLKKMDDALYDLKAAHLKAINKNLK